MGIINYDTLTFPNLIRSINDCFINTEGFGELNWKKIFSGTYNNLTSITYSFVLSGVYLENRV